jgi:hypothetical protein
VPCDGGFKNPKKILKDFHKAQRLTKNKIIEIPLCYHPIPKVKISSTFLIFCKKKKKIHSIWNIEHGIDSKLIFIKLSVHG